MPGETHDGTIEVNILFHGEIRLETNTEFEKWRNLPVHLCCTGIRVQHAGKDLEERAFSRSRLHQ